MSADSNDWTAVTVSSRKGFGPLASTSTRLAQKLSYTGPGPGSYSPAGPSRQHPASEAGSAAFCTTGRSFSASGSTTSNSSSSPAPGPGAHGVPRLAHTGTDLAWASPAKAGAAAAFKAAPRSTSASASLLREKLQQQKYHDGQPVPWLLAPPKTIGGRPCPGPRLLHSAHPSTRRALQERPQHTVTRATLGTQPLGQVLQPLTSTCSSSSSSRQDSRAVPGPGSYDLYKYGALQESAQTHRSAFMRPLVQDRFGASTLRHPAQQQQQQPQESQQQSTMQRQDYQHTKQSGQGSVHDRRPAEVCRYSRLSYPVSSRQPGVSAGFRSRSPGHTEALLAAADGSMVGAPGPSYYNPQAPPHKVSYRQTRSARTFVAAV